MQLEPHLPTPGQLKEHLQIYLAVPVPLMCPP